MEFKVSYNPRHYNALTYKIPVFIKAYDNGVEFDDFMALFNTNYLAEEFRDFVKELIVEGMTFTDYLSLKKEYKAY